MNRFVVHMIFIVLLLLFPQFALEAKDAKIDEISKAIQLPLYDYNDDIVKEILGNYLKHSNFEAFQLFYPPSEDEPHEIYISSWIKNDQVHHILNDDFPAPLDQTLLKLEREIHHNNMIIGKITGYLDQSQILSDSPNLTDSPFELSQPEKVFLLFHPIIRAHNDPNFAPFNFVRDGKPIGYTIDLLNLLAQKLNIKIEYISGPNRSEFFEMFKRNDIDIFSNIVKTPKHEQFINFTQPIIMHPPYIYSRANKNQQYSNLAELQNRTVGVVKGYWYQEALTKNHPHIEIYFGSDNLDILKKLASGKVDAVINIDVVMQHLMLENSISNVKITGKAEFPNQYHYDNRIGVRKDWPLLVSAFDKALKSVTYQEDCQLKARWFKSLSEEQQLKVMPLTKKEQALLNDTQNMIAKKNLPNDIKNRPHLFSSPESSHISNTEQKTDKVRIVLSDEEQAYLNQKGVIKFCVDPNWPPFEFIDANGQVQGIIKDYLRLFHEVSNIEFQLLPSYSWKETLEFAKTKQCDIISEIAPTHEREAYLNFTLPYIDYPQVVVTKKDKPFILSLNDMLDQQFGATEGYAIVEILLNKFPDIQIQTFNNIHDGLAALHSGQIDAFIDYLPTIVYHLQKNRFTDLKISGKLEEKIKLCVGSRNDEPLLGSIMNKIIQSINPAEHRKIHSQWASIQYENDNSLLWKIVATASIIAICVFLLIIRLAVLTRKMKQSIALAEKSSQAANEFRELYQSLIASTTDPIIMYDLKGQAKFINDAFLHTFGWQLEEIQQGISFVPDSEREKTKIKRKEIVEKGMTVTRFETLRYKKDGTLLNVSINGSRFSDHLGNPAGILVILRDISALQMQKELELHQDKR